MTNHEAFLLCALIVAVIYVVIIQRDRAIYEQRWRDARDQCSRAIRAIIDGCPTKQATGNACAGCSAPAERVEDAPMTPERSKGGEP